MQRTRPRAGLMTVTMSVKKRTSPQEWIHDYFSPVLTVYANEVKTRKILFKIFALSQTLYQSLAKGS